MRRHHRFAGSEVEVEAVPRTKNLIRFKVALTQGRTAVGTEIVEGEVLNLISAKTEDCDLILPQSNQSPAFSWYIRGHRNFVITHPKSLSVEFFVERVKNCIIHLRKI